ncbi:MAG: hypothetical protein R6X02_16275 [Enhygromyxa sp.]
MAALALVLVFLIGALVITRRSDGIERIELDALGHVGDPRSLHWVDLDAEKLELSCVDGRSQDEVIGTPGGDAGELLLLLAAAEAEGLSIDPEAVPELIEAWIGEFGGFYLHTDDHALAELGRTLAADPRFAAELVELDGDLARLEAWLRSPPPELHEPLLAHLVDPDAVGCGHLRSILRSPADYGVRPALAGAVIMSFYRRLWVAPDELRFVVLHGHHHERAVLDVEHEPALDHLVPLIRPDNAHDQVFVVQPQAIAAVRARAVELLAAREPELDRAVLRGRMDTLGAEQLAATLAHLDVHVPTIRVIVDHHATRSVTTLRHQTEGWL